MRSRRLSSIQHLFILRFFLAPFCLVSSVSSKQHGDANNNTQYEMYERAKQGRGYLARCSRWPRNVLVSPALGRLL